MLRTTTTLLFLSITIACSAQKYFTRDGHVSFLSETPMENIDAQNNKSTCVLDMETGKFEFAVLMKSFEFEKPLMEEHFNENYVESAKYPKSTFKGEITNLKEAQSNGFSPDFVVNAKGMLSIHGVELERTIEAHLVKEGEGFKVTSQFLIDPEEHGIKIPATVRDNIAKELVVDVEADLVELKR